MGAAVMDRPVPPPGFVYEDDPLASLPAGFEIGEPEVLPGPVPSSLPSPAVDEPEEIPEVTWDRKTEAAFKVLPDGRVMFDPDRFDAGLEQAFEGGLIDGELYGRLKPDADAFRAALEARRELEAQAGAVPEAKAFLQGAGRAGAMTLGFLGGAKVGAAAGALAGPAAPVVSPIAAVLAGVVGSVAADKAYQATYEKLAENDAEFASYLAAKELKPAWGMAGELSGIVLPAAGGAVAMTNAVRTIAQSQGPKAAAAFAGRVMGTGAVAGAAMDPVVRTVENVATRKQSPAEILAEGEREPLPIFDAGSMAASAAMMAGLSTISVGNRKFNAADVRRIFEKPEAKRTPNERAAVSRAVEMAETVAAEYGAGVKGADLLLRQVTVGNRPVLTTGQMTVTPPPAGALGTRGMPAAGPSGPVMPEVRALPAAPVRALPSAEPGRFVMGRGGVPMAPVPGGPIAAAGGATRAALPGVAVPLPPAGFEVVPTVPVKEVVVPGAGGQTVPVPEVLPAPKAKKGFSLAFVHSDITPVISWIASNRGLARTRSGREGGENDAMQDAMRAWGPWSRALLNSNGMAIDKAATLLYQEGLIPEPSPDVLRAVVDAEIQTYRKVRDETKAQAAEVKQWERENRTEIRQARNFGNRVATPRENAMNLPVAELQPGDVVTVDGHEIKVREIDPETFDVTLENGAKFGIQTVQDGQVLFVDKAELVPRLEDVFPTPENARTIETMGEGNLFGEQEMPFNLAGDVDLVSRTPQELRERDAQAQREAAASGAQEDMFASVQRSGSGGGVDYRGTHTAPTGKFNEGSLDAMNRTYPDDLYSKDGARFYGDTANPRWDREMHQIILAVKGKPEAEVTVYRAIPKGMSETINAGDWVTPYRPYAESHGERFEGGFDILSKKVRAGELFTEGNSLFEFGWGPKVENIQQSGGPAQPGAQPRAAAGAVPNWALQTPETPKGARLFRGIERQDKKGAGFRDLVNFVNDSVRVEMRRSKSQTSKKHPAHYMATGHLARTRNTQSQVNFHEAGHGVQFMLLARNPQIFDGVAQELMAFADRPGSMASKGPDKAYKIGEGVAEWMRMRIVDPQAVEGMQAGAVIEAGLNEYYPGVAAAIRDAARAHYRFQNLPAEVRWAKFNQEAVAKPSLKEIGNAALRLGTTAANALASGAPLSGYDRKIFRAIVKNRQEVGMSYREAVRAARQVRARTTEVLENYNLILSIGAETQMAISGKGEMRGIRMVGPDGKMRRIFPKTWQEIVKQVPGPLYEQFEQGGWALEALNRWTKDQMEYPGMREGITPKDLRAIVEQARKDIPNFGQLFKEVQGYFDALLDLKDLGGLKADGEVLKMRRRGLYWPMPRVIESMSAGGAGVPRGQVTAGDFRAYGSGEAIMDLNTVAEQRTREAMTAFYWNQLGHSIVRNFQKIARDTKLPLEARMLAGRAMVPMAMEQKVAATLSREEVQQMVYRAVLEQRAADLGVTTEELAMQFKPEDINLAFNFKDIYRPVAPKDVNVVSLLDQGERRFFQIQDEGLFMMFARPDQVSSFMRGVSWLIGPTMQNWKRNITQSLPFALANLAGDVINQMMLNPREAGWVPGGATMLGIWNKFSQKYPQVFQEGILMSRVEPSSVELVNAMRENAVINWLTEGWYQATDKDPTKRLLKTLLQPSNLLFPIYKTGDAINLATGGRTVAPLLETATREGAAVAVLMRGGTDREAMNAYWGVTGRFNEHAGTADARAAFSLPGFFNPMVQAVRGAGQLVTDPDPAIRMSAWAKLLMVFPAMFGGAAVARFLMMDEDEKQRERERPIEDRLNYYDVAGFRLRFPYGPEGAMGSFVYNAVMDDLLDRPKVDGKRTGVMLIKRIADVGTPLQFLGPQLNAVTEAQMNWSNFQQRHIVSPWMVGLPASEQFSSTTPEFYRKLGRWMDYSPAKLQYIVRQGISRQADEVVRLLSDVEAGRGTEAMFQEAADIPFVGRMFLREPLGFGAASVQTLQDLDARLDLLNKRLGTAGYSWIKEAPADQLPIQLQAVRAQWDALEMLRAGSRQLELIGSLASAAKVGNDALTERNYRRMMVLYAQSILAMNPDAAERIEMALEMLETVPEASPQMKQADYLQRRF
jgi:hypothetical protein